MSLEAAKLYYLNFSYIQNFCYKSYSFSICIEYIDLSLPYKVTCVYTDTSFQKYNPVKGTSILLLLYTI